MRCCICHRSLNASAAPGLVIGPKCARDRGLLPATYRRVRVISPAARQHTDPAQTDWVNLINAGKLAGESRA